MPRKPSALDRGRCAITAGEPGALARHVVPLNDATEVPAWWSSLYRSAGNASIFLSSDWIDTWLEIHGSGFRGCWVRWEHQGDVVGGVLLLTGRTDDRGVGFRSVFLNATGKARERAPLAEYNDVLFMRGFEEPIALDLASFLCGLHWDRFYASGYEDDGVISRLVARLPAIATDIDSKPAPYVDMEALRPGAFECSAGTNTRSQIRRCRRLYEEMFGAVAVTRAESLDEAMEFFAQMGALHNARWEAKGVVGSFATKSLVEFHCRLMPRLWEHGAVDMIRVSAGKKAIGFVYNFLAHGKVYFFQSGFAYEADGKLKPGLLTHALVIDYYRAQGLREYDFMAGDAQYKRSLTKDQRVLHWTIVHRGGLYTRAFLFVRKLKGMIGKLLAAG